MKLNQQKLDQLIKDRYISVQKHPHFDYFIYNYTQKTQFDRVWTPETLQCRGLILDSQGTVVGRPFPKFFNYEEVPSLPNESFHVFDKMDGSLIIVAPVKDKLLVATRGSFNSEQARLAEKLLMEKYISDILLMQEGITYLFELVGPSNRIVVNYKEDELVFLAGIETATGRELLHTNNKNSWYPFTLIKPVRFYKSITDHTQLKTMFEENREGYVIRFESGLRVKVKFDEYIRLHKIVTDMNEKRVWELMKTNNGNLPEEFLKEVPDEFYKWIQSVKQKLLADFDSKRKECLLHYHSITFENKSQSRKEFAQKALFTPYPTIMFALLDNRNINFFVWDLVKPT